MGVFTKPTFGCEESPRPSPAGVSRSRHIEMLVIASLAMVASFLLSVNSGGEGVHVTFLPKLPIPETCFSREFFGVDCPGCGLTRSFVYLAHFDWHASWQMHRLGWLMFLATLLQIPYRSQALLTSNGSVVPVSLAKRFGNALIVLLVANWLCGLIFVNAINGN